ncbi:MAG TPA: cupin domain-containing protein [Kiritimatiellia bacterium]|nr:cupin domain-containing protein [Kiritimatiellia bacterium]HMO99492.1 cupin domain-containing protein [Kiritimatiellia bacterium]HMP97997.1 cupin domain-containing protein [Kiritimatiellia bacterium]
MTAQDIIAALNLAPHPEGGYFRETYRASEIIPADALPPEYRGGRSASTAIYFLLTGDTFSALHRLRSDEIWHYHAGDAVDLHLLHADGSRNTLRVGADLAAGERPQAVIPAGCWFGARVTRPDGFTLIGCTVAPGFDFADFELADRTALTAAYPGHRDFITAFTRTP